MAFSCSFLVYARTKLINSKFLLVVVSNYKQFLLICHVKANTMVMCILLHNLCTLYIIRCSPLVPVSWCCKVWTVPLLSFRDLRFSRKSAFLSRAMKSGFLLLWSSVQHTYEYRWSLLVIMDFILFAITVVAVLQIRTYSEIPSLSMVLSYLWVFWSSLNVE